MRANWKHARVGLGLLVTAALAGCTFHAQPGVEVEAYPAGYAAYPDTAYDPGYYDPVYYDRGYYDGPNWVWVGPDHHRYYEGREWHERRWHEHEYHEREYHGRHWH